MSLDDLHGLISILRANGVVEYEHDGTRLRLLPVMPSMPEAPNLSDAEKRDLRSKLLFSHELPEFPARRPT